MRITFKIVLSILLFALLVAIGTEVVALHRGASRAAVSSAASPVVIRKSDSAAMPPKMVRKVAVSPRNAIPAHLAALPAQEEE